jgi:hypothetical protein
VRDNGEFKKTVFEGFGKNKTESYWGGVERLRIK